jgi:hypothetical protein
MPLFRDGVSRAAWRRSVAAWVADRVDDRGTGRFVGSTVEDRREMLQVARMLPGHLLAEIYEDPHDPRRTILEVRAHARPVEMGSGFRIIRGDEYEATG